MPNTGNAKEISIRPPRKTGSAARETITAVIMTKNAESLVEGTLKSVADWVDEIVVIDGFSTDRTEEICRRYTDKFYQNRWDGYRFCTERNLGISKSTSDWCFHVDPDERATPDFREAVLKMLSAGTSHSAFEFRKKNFFMGHWMKHGGWFHYSLHLFRRTRGIYDGVIHETLHVDGTIGKLEAAVEHYPFTSISQFVSRHNGYSTREALAVWEEAKELPASRVRYEIYKKPFKRFIKFYIRKKGYLDGYHGFIFSVLYAWVHFMNWSKYWELLEGKKESPIAR